MKDFTSWTEPSVSAGQLIPHPERWAGWHQGMLISPHWELLWIRWTKGSTKEILNSQSKADIPLLASNISETNPTHISPLLSLWEPPRKDRLLSLPHTTSVSFSPPAHKRPHSLFFCFMFQTAEHRKSLAGLGGRQLLGAQDCGKRIAPFSP